MHLNFENQTLNHVFYPDITLKFPNGVFCDIEIDEPYCEEDKQPIHCLDFDTNCHADEERTDYFLKHDWCVIRFAEEQIVQYPLSCIKYVLQVVDYFFSSNNYSTLLETIDDLELVECWDTAKAQQLAEQDHRLNYLNR